MTKARITVQASASHPNLLEVRDAMRQVLDFFELLSDESDARRLDWNLVFASTNSPFCAEAEAVPLVSSVDVQPLARSRVQEVSALFASLAAGEVPHEDMTKRKIDAAVRILQRNTNGIGRTVFDSVGVTETVITPVVAEVSLSVLAGGSPSPSYIPKKRDRREFGSVEGTFLEIGTHYQRPAIRIIERKTGRTIPCRVDRSVIDSIAASVDLRDVWAHQRVIVRGRIHYDPEGKISHINAREVSRVTPRSMTLHDIAAPDFTSQYSTREYIDRLREGNLA
jgi:hypothetical protein